MGEDLDQILENPSLYWGEFHTERCGSLGCKYCQGIIDGRNNKLGEQFTPEEWESFDRFWSGADGYKNRFERCLNAFKAGVLANKRKEQDNQFGQEYVRVNGKFVPVNEFDEYVTYIKVGDGFVDKRVIASNLEE